MPRREKIGVVIPIRRRLIFLAALIYGEREPCPAADSTPPETQITGGPADKTRDRTPRFRFQAGEPATFECRRDGRSWRSCASPKPYQRLGLGWHRFRVRATDLAGNVEAEPASVRFRITARAG